MFQPQCKGQKQSNTSSTEPGKQGNRQMSHFSAALNAKRSSPNILKQHLTLCKVNEHCLSHCIPNKSVFTPCFPCLNGKYGFISRPRVQGLNFFYKNVNLYLFVHFPLLYILFFGGQNWKRSSQKTYKWQIWYSLSRLSITYAN